jgi:hypothetical protein
MTIQEKVLEEKFTEFLCKYLNNVQKELPSSYRAIQLKAGGIFAQAVYEFETRFLRQPFIEALREIEKLVREEVKTAIDEFEKNPCQWCGTPKYCVDGETLCSNWQELKEMLGIE